MNIRKIIQEEVSDFDWVNNVDYMKLYSVQQLEDGKYYVFHPKNDVVDPQRPGSPPPDWVHDYEGQTIQVIHNDRIGRRIELIPHGKITRMRWKEKTTSVTLDHMAQMFVYGEFSEVQGITESSEFNWMEKVNHISFEYLNNKALEFNPPLDNIHSVENILDELKELGFTSFDPDTLIFEDEDGMEHVVGLYMADGHVVWTGDIFETYQEHIDDYADRHVEIIDGNNLFGSLITESEDFDWAEDVPINPIHVGALFYLDGKSIDEDYYWDEGDFMVLEIIEVGDEVKYVTRYTNIEDEGKGSIEYTEYNRVKELIDTEYWKPWDGKQGLTESSDFDWVDNVSEYHSVLNKAFYFYPVARRGDGDYSKLVQYLKNLGFKSQYSTPDTTDSDSAVGLYAYRNRDGELSYVYTHDDEDDYENHILGFASDESEDGGKNLEVIDARDFVKSI